MTPDGSLGSPARSGRGAVPDGRHRRVIRGPGHRPRAGRDDHGLEPCGGAALRLFSGRGARRVDRHPGAARAARRVGQPAGDRARRATSSARSTRSGWPRTGAGSTSRSRCRRSATTRAGSSARPPSRATSACASRPRSECAAARRSSPRRSGSRRSGAGSGTSLQRGELVAGAVPHPRTTTPTTSPPATRPTSTAIHPSDRARSQAAGEDTIASGPPVDLECRVLRPGCVERVIHARGRMLKDDAGQAVRMVGTVQDITGLAQTRQRLEQANRAERGAAELCRRRHLRARPGGAGHVRQPRRDRADRPFGRGDARPPPSRARPSQPRGRDPPTRPGTARARARSSRASRAPSATRSSAAATARASPSSTRRRRSARATRSTGALVVFRDITERRRIENELERLNAVLAAQARRDPLTGLGNRLRLEEDLASYDARRVRYGHSYCVLLCDLDHFKTLNDRQGHQAGDERPVRGGRDARAREPHQRRRLPLRRRGAAGAAGRAVARGRADRLRADARGGAGARPSRTPRTRPAS